MIDHDEVKKWFESNCPLSWSLLNSHAKRNLPKGLIEYIGDGSSSEIEVGRTSLETIERYLKELKDLCGWQSVGDSYRRHLSGANSENQLCELLCEIAICASIGKLSASLKISPRTEKGTYSDCRFNIAGFDIYGEVKRYLDPWPLIEKPGEVPNETIPYSRSISKSPSNEKPQGCARPRYMDLRSKLRNVPKQFPESTINILFLFHGPSGETKHYITQALWGESNFFNNDDNFVVETDGLFAMDEWRNVSACCLARCNPELRIILPLAWKNPRAFSGVPKLVLGALNIGKILEHNDRNSSAATWLGNDGMKLVGPISR